MPDLSGQARAESEKLFDGIAPRYDRANRLLSLGLDRGWRKKAVAALKPFRPRCLLDLATGSGDLALAALDAGVEQITAVDISARMMAAAAAKIAKVENGERIVLRRAAAESLPFADESFDAVIVGFGVRNFADLDKGLSEMRRILKPGGVAVILEFSLPSAFPARSLHRFYLRKIVPLIGWLASGSRAPYVHLGESILTFPDGAAFIAVLKRNGFKRMTYRRLSFGACSIYTAIK